MTDTFLDDTRQRLREFARERDWDQFHSPKNLAMALAAEAGELIEHFQWLSESDSCKLDAGAKAEVGHELADVMLYLIRLADRLDIDVAEAVKQKLVLNEAKYPRDLVRGSSRKYTEY
ncbi:MAG: nucleotide pyrophosphohydrolase [Gammaproteobacteria bacterium]|nr:nucleotide pyrophosphohydrolase [Gammaproteobacteria bacterium]